MARRQIRETGKYFQDGRVRRGITFAMVPAEILTSSAARECPDYAMRVLFALAAQFRSSNNGDLSLTAAVAKKFGITPEWRLRAGLEILERAGLIERMRTGRIENGKGICHLFALGWRQIDPSDKYDIPSVVATTAPNRWAKWVAPQDWEQSIVQIKHRAMGKKNRPPNPDYVGRTTPVGEEAALPPHTGEVGRHSHHTTRADSLLDSGSRPGGINSSSAGDC